MWSRWTHPRSQNSAAVVLVYPYGILVDRDGRRFIDEGRGLVHETWEHVARTIHFATPGGSAYAILDARLHEIPGHERAIRSEVPPQARFEATRADGLGSAPGLSPPKSNWCRPLDRPPYLAYPLIGAIAYTFGGLATNADGEVLGPAGPVPALSAAGEITGHFHGTARNAVAMLRALVFGRIAGRRAVAFCRGASL